MRYQSYSTFSTVFIFVSPIAMSEGTAPRLTTLQSPLRRVASAGFFEATDVPDDTSNMFPPARVMDVKVVGANAEDNTITVTWTAVGDELDRGQGLHLDS